MTPRPRRSPRSVRYARLACGALATVAGLKLVAWSVRSAAPGRPASLRAPASPLIQRVIVPDVRAALQGVLEGEKGGRTAVAVLDCWDGRWASVWAASGGGGAAAAAAVPVAVDDVVCINFSGAPDAGDGVTADERMPAASPVPWLHHRISIIHVDHAPRGGLTTPSAKLAAAVGRKVGGGGGGRPASPSPTRLPTTILALASPDGQGMSARYLTLMTSLPTPRLILVDAGNTIAADGIPTGSKKPRAPGFQVVDAAPAPRHSNSAGEAPGAGKYLYVSGAPGMTVARPWPLAGTTARTYSGGMEKPRGWTRTVRLPAGRRMGAVALARSASMERRAATNSTTYGVSGAKSRVYCVRRVLR